MQTVLIVIHLMIVLALVGIVLVQRSEGGGLGIGGGSGFMSARGAANALTRTTGILAAAFFITSLALGILARYSDSPTDIHRPDFCPNSGHRLGRSRPARRRACTCHRAGNSSSWRGCRRYPGSTSAHPARMCRLASKASDPATRFLSTGGCAQICL
jgi:preprotein translocase subunit SecG